MDKIDVKVTWNGGERVESGVECRESAVWSIVGKCLLECRNSLPNTMKVETEKGNAVLELGIRGTYIENGKTYPSMYVQVNNNIDLPADEYEAAYLTCVHAESNNYKFYKLEPKNDVHLIDASWGRIGTDIVSHLKQPYQSYLYWVRYYEKLSKGYVDQTKVYLPKENKGTKVVEKKKGKDLEPGSVGKADKELYDLLYGYSYHYAKQELLDISVTEPQVREAKKIYNEMVKRKTVKGFNNQLLKLIQVSPRREGHTAAYRTATVQSLMAKDVRDFARIIGREEALIQSMEALLTGTNVSVASFAALGVEVYEATDEQVEQVKGKLTDQLKGMVAKVYRVIPKGQQKRFNEYIKKNDIKVVKQLWHGSKNCNWLSIIDNGLQLNPAAEITGKMFGNGIYFAPSSAKSWNYTSYHGTYWAKGTDNVGIMGLYATAYGKPHDVNSAGKWYQERLDNMGKNCVHAHAGNQLRNDEIIYYNESAMVLNYIVVFK